MVYPVYYRPLTARAVPLFRYGGDDVVRTRIIRDFGRRTADYGYQRCDNTDIGSHSRLVCGKEFAEIAARAIQDKDSEGMRPGRHHGGDQQPNG